MASVPAASASQPHELRTEARGTDLVAVCFEAMASPCELLLPFAEHTQALEWGALVANEAWRIEKKYSRYRPDSVTTRINGSAGAALTLDEETLSLFGFARTCFEMSEGLFDITSGVLRRAWHFDGSDNVPEPAAIAQLLPRIGFDKLLVDPPRLRMPAQMEIDFGGIGKEYAVDRAFQLLAARTSCPFLINFGGDLRASEPPGDLPWQVGVEKPGADHAAGLLLDLERGALATSGDARRFLCKSGVRYGHILDPRTGWPVPGAPRSVTVAASTCTEAGLLSTLALLKGGGARSFLDEQAVSYWVLD